MTNLQQLWDKCLVAAKAKLEAVKAEYGHVELYAFNVGTQDSSGNSSGTESSTFERTGTTESTKTYSLPAALAALINRSAMNTEVSGDQRALENAFLNLVMQTAGPSNVPGANLLDSTIGLDPTTYAGAPAINNILKSDPYSSDWKEGTEEDYIRAFDVARSRAASGPDAVRGGQGRVALEQAELGSDMSRNRFREVRENRSKEAGIVEQATQIANTIDGMRRGHSLQAQGQAVQGQQAQAGKGFEASSALSRRYQGNMANVAAVGEMLGVPRTLQTDNLRGKGTQATQTTTNNHGMDFKGGCCFIFLQALNGGLPWYVRIGRNEFNTPARRRGYIWMSSWLVPWMKRSNSLQKLVNFLLVKPFLRWGLKHYEGGPPCWALLKPVCWFWFYLWSLLGHSVRRVNYAD